MNYPMPMSQGPSLVVILISLVFSLAIYVYVSFSLMTIANKTNTPNGWMAWVPFLNFWLMTQIARKEVLWFVLCLIPCINIIALIVIWMGIAEARNKPSWWGVMLIVPIMNLIMPGYLAFSD